MPSAPCTPPPPAVGVRFTNVVYAAPGSRPHALSPHRSAPVTILHGVSAYVRPGESLAILGPSGSGKTSLLNVLAARTEQPPVAGLIRFGPRPRVPRTKRHLGYVMQDDVFFSNLTVRETLDFTASIRLPRAVSAPDKAARVDAVLRRLRLSKCQHTRIGDQQFDKGISGGERKRVNIANELLHEPSVLLADECTSGLDSSSAFTVINLLRDLCQEGRTVIATIHQPSSQMFSLFDKILLLAAGRVAYFGPPSKVVPYFEGIGFPFPTAAYNPADYMLELVIDDRPNDADPDAPSVQQRILDAWQSNGPQTLGDHELIRQLREVQTVSVDNATSSNHVALAFDPHADDNDDDDDDDDHADANNNLESGCQQQVDRAPTQETSDTQSTSDPDLDDAPGPGKPDLDVQLAQDPFPPTSLFGRILRAGHKRLLDVTGRHGINDEPDKYPTNWWTQTFVLGKRALRQKRGALLQPVYIAQVLAVTLISCLCWFRIEPSETTIEDRLGALSFFSVFWAFYSAFSALFAFPAEKQVLNKDRAGGSYRLSAYFFAKSMIETPADMIYPTVFTIVVYFAVGLNPTAASFFLFNIILVLNVLAAQSVGLLISALVMDVKQGQVLASVWILSSMLISGYYIDPDNTPSFVRPFRSLSFIKFSYEAMVRVETLGGREFRCANTADGEKHTIYSQNGDDCPIDQEALLKGAQLTSSLSIPGAIMVLIAFIVTTRIIGYFALKLLHTSHKPRRSSWKQSV